MSVLTDPFPKTISVHGTEYPVRWDFRTALQCDQILRSQGELTEEILLKALLKFYVRRPLMFGEEHINQMFWFFTCGREKDKRRFPRKEAGINNKQPFDFEKDADVIYAGFLQQYRIDLQKENMHWWKFMILLENLGTDTKLAKLIEYRTVDIANKNLSKEMRNFYKAMQQYYGLDRAPVVMDEKAKRIEEALLNGGDVSKLLNNTCE